MPYTVRADAKQTNAAALVDQWPADNRRFIQSLDRDCICTNLLKNTATTTATLKNRFLKLHGSAHNLKTPTELTSKWVTEHLLLNATIQHTHGYYRGVSYTKLSCGFTDGRGQMLASGNTPHLHARPGADLIKSRQKLHEPPCGPRGLCATCTFIGQCMQPT
jgi:hypothetical protein